MVDKQTLDIMWLDTETTGLINPRLCEIGWIITDWKLNEKSSFQAVVDPKYVEVDLETEDTKTAFVLNGYPELVEACKLTGELLQSPWTTGEQWFDAAKGKRVAGSNPSYDIDVMSFYSSYPVSSLLNDHFGDYHTLDVCSVAAPLLLTNEIRSLSASTSISTWAGLGEEPKPHRALYGARRALELYRRLVKRYGCA